MKGMDAAVVVFVRLVLYTICFNLLLRKLLKADAPAEMVGRGANVSVAVVRMNCLHN